MPTERHLSDAFTCWEKLCLLASALTHSGLSLFNFYVAYTYYVNGHFWYCFLTSAFTVLPLFAMFCLNMRDYSNPQHNQDVTSSMKAFRVVCMVIVPLNVWPRFFENWLYGVRYTKAKEKDDEGKKRRYSKQLEIERRTVAFIRLRKAFLESAPQLTFHLYIMANGDLPTSGQAHSDKLAWITMAISAVSLAWTLAKSRSFIHSLDAARASSNNAQEVEMTWLDLGHLAAAHFFGIVSRCIALGLLASMVGLGTWLTIACHVAAFLLLAYQVREDLQIRHVALDPESDFELERVGPVSEFFLLLLFAAISLFGYVHNNGRFHYKYYYLICLIENLLIMVSWLCVGAQAASVYNVRHNIFICQLASFAVSVTLINLFYDRRLPAGRVGQ